MRNGAPLTRRRFCQPRAACARARTVPVMSRHFFETGHKLRRRHRSDIDARLLGLIEKLRIMMRSVKRRLQCLGAVSRHARGCCKWPRHGQQGSLSELDQVVTFLSLCEFACGWDIRKIGMARVTRKLDQQVVATAWLEPLGLGRLDGGEVGRAATYLVALHREEDRGAVAV